MADEAAEAPEAAAGGEAAPAAEEPASAPPEPAPAAAEPAPAAPPAEDSQGKDAVDKDEAGRVNEAAAADDAGLEQKKTDATLALDEAKATEAVGKDSRQAKVEALQTAIKAAEEAGVGASAIDPARSALAVEEPKFQCLVEAADVMSQKPIGKDAHEEKLKALKSCLETAEKNELVEEQEIKPMRSAVELEERRLKLLEDLVKAEAEKNIEFLKTAIEEGMQPADVTAEQPESLLQEEEMSQAKAKLRELDLRGALETDMKQALQDNDLSKVVDTRDGLRALGEPAATTTPLLEEADKAIAELLLRPTVKLREEIDAEPEAMPNVLKETQLVTQLKANLSAASRSEENRGASEDELLPARKALRAQEERLEALLVLAEAINYSGEWYSGLLFTKQIDIDKRKLEKLTDVIDNTKSRLREVDLVNPQKILEDMKAKVEGMADPEQAAKIIAREKLRKAQLYEPAGICGGLLGRLCCGSTGFNPHERLIANLEAALKEAEEVGLEPYETKESKERLKFEQRVEDAIIGLLQALEMGTKKQGSPTVMEPLREAVKEAQTVLRCLPVEGQAFLGDLVETAKIELGGCQGRVQGRHVGGLDTADDRKKKALKELSIAMQGHVGPPAEEPGCCSLSCLGRAKPKEQAFHHIKELKAALKECEDAAVPEEDVLEAKCMLRDMMGNVGKRIEWLDDQLGHLEEHYMLRRAQPPCLVRFFATIYDVARSIPVFNIAAFALTLFGSLLVVQYSVHIEVLMAQFGSTRQMEGVTDEERFTTEAIAWLQLALFLTVVLDGTGTAAAFTVTGVIRGWLRESKHKGAAKLLDEIVGACFFFMLVVLLVVSTLFFLGALFAILPLQTLLAVVAGACDGGAASLNGVAQSLVWAHLAPEGTETLEGLKAFCKSDYEQLMGAFVFFSAGLVCIAVGQAVQLVITVYNLELVWMSVDEEEDLTALPTKRW
eukprot:TRINITY_DN80710_c0_g1_i1.p1 TRINITY_DN80710_c0_g1~~TRINITY_DN80710_c0_g1_i1.p1  ORF type:complete len:953 (+),score=329.77 TRINITY_DN80710_c0_g1_i1:126-2984(+)